jgi:peptidoglycan/LPS O-acetylase OafA/YrhL
MVENRRTGVAKKFAWFDSFRFFAVLLVIAAHAGTFYNDLPASLRPVLSCVQSASWMGVDLFFVLSGFLVSGLLFDEFNAKGKVDLRRFLIRRAFKIIPAFYFLTAVTLVYDVIENHGINWAHLVHDLLFLQSYRMGEWSHAWTLAVEVHFYCLLALLVWWSIRRYGAQWPQAIPRFMAALMLFSITARWLTSGEYTNFNVHKQLFETHLHLDVLAAGVLLRYLFTYAPERLAFLDRARPLWILLGLYAISFSAYLFYPHSRLMTTFIPSLNAFGFSTILYQFTQIPFPRNNLFGWLFKPVDYFGSHSYSIYLWHMPVMAWILPLFFERPGLLYLGAFIILSLAVGTFFSVILEHPVLRWRNHWFPSETVFVKDPTLIR